eukprot:jgi/Chlat1/6421/Chrsp45S05921
MTGAHSRTGSAAWSHDGDFSDDDDEPPIVAKDPSGRYGRYAEVLGEGACKIVYKAFDEVEGMEVAWNECKMQFITSSTGSRDVMHEVDLLKALNHKNVMRLHDSWIDPHTGHVIFITEIFTSGTLRQYRNKHRKADIKAVKSWTRQILRGLLYLHSHEPPVIHRDLKLDNIFVNGNLGEVKIGDLGLAALLQHSRTAHTCLGTPEYMAAELYDEEYDEKVDIYAFGMLLLEVLTQERPYSECTNPAQIYKKVTSGVKPACLFNIKDPAVLSFIQLCVSHRPSDRLSAGELLTHPFLSATCPRMLGHGECVVRVNSTEPISKISGAAPIPRVATAPELLADLAQMPRRPQSQASNRQLRTAAPPPQAVAHAADGHPPRPHLFAPRPLHAQQRQSSLLDLRDVNGVLTHAGFAHMDSQKISPNSTPSTPDLPRNYEGVRITGLPDHANSAVVHLRIRIRTNDDNSGRVIKFAFDSTVDTAGSVANEMVEVLQVSELLRSPIVEGIEQAVQSCIPNFMQREVTAMAPLSSPLQMSILRDSSTGWTRVA